MPDYNDGNWWPHQPGDCPVHPESTVAVLFRDSDDVHSVGWSAGQLKWGELRGGTIVAFRVVTPYVEPRTPREYWVVYCGATNVGVYFSEEVANKAADRFHTSGTEVIHVREVVDE